MKIHGVRLVSAALLVVSLITMSFTPLAAMENSSIATGYASDQELVPGTIVSLDDAASDTKVKAANTSNVSKLIGVVTNSSLVELSSESGKYSVASDGTASVLVSNVGGDIKKGDPITASPVSGVGMKAVESAQIIGRAGASYADATQKTSRNVSLSDGGTQTIEVGLLPVLINVSYFEKQNDESSFLPSFLQNIANNIAGSQVSPIRVLVALFILTAGLGGAAIMLSASVRSSIISIGRNPLSAKAVHRSLFEVGGIGIGVLLVMLIAVYLVLIL